MSRDPSELVEQAYWVLSKVAPNATSSAVLTSGFSHAVISTEDVVLKVGDARDHRRLLHEVLIVSELPKGLGAELLDAGELSLDGQDLLWALYKRCPGSSVSKEWSTLNATTQRTLTIELIERLRMLHTWTPRPGSPADVALSAPAWTSTSSDEHFFFSYDQLLADVSNLLASIPTDKSPHITHHLLSDVLGFLIDLGPTLPAPHHPTHADASWQNVLWDGSHVTTLLDYEWAYYSSVASEVFRLFGYAEHALPIVAQALTDYAPDWLATPDLAKRLRLRYISDAIMVASTHLNRKNKGNSTTIEWAATQLSQILSYQSDLDTALTLVGLDA